MLEQALIKKLEVKKVEVEVKLKVELEVEVKFYLEAKVKNQAHQRYDIPENC